MPVGTSRTDETPRATTAERRAQVVSVASALAAAGGYDAVTMKAVADDSGVALATLYRWFDSKDHLLAEVLLAWLGELGPAVSEAVMRATTASERVERIMALVGDTVAAEPKLAAAAITALLADDPAVLAIFDTFHAEVGGWLADALDADMPDRDVVVEVLEHLVWSSLIALVRGRDTPATVRVRLVRAAHLLAR